MISFTDPMFYVLLIIVFLVSLALVCVYVKSDN